LANSWHPVAVSDEIGDGPRAIALLERKIVLWRTASGAVIAAPDRCPHREAPLSIGTVTDGCLTCAYHGWTFGEDGRCVLVPSSGDGAAAPPRAHLVPYHCEEQYGLVWVCLGTPAGPIPPIAQDSDPAFRRINTPVDIWRVSATRMVDNFLDIAHFPYVHVGTFGRQQDPLVARVELQPLDDQFYGYRYEVLADNTTGSASSGQGGDVVHREMATGFSLPFAVRSTIRYDSGLEHILLLLSTPIDDVTSYFTFVVWRNDDFAVSADEIIRFDLAIGAEDKRMLEQLDGMLPLDQTTLVSVQADRCSVEWRRQLASFI
jgi:phenylpropionate dioxygenase-like ring-hydroxylating dioxygenase large terminal subunit